MNLTVVKPDGVWSGACYSNSIFSTAHIDMFVCMYVYVSVYVCMYVHVYINCVCIIMCVSYVGKNAISC